jgi:hypothetical protein
MGNGKGKDICSMVVITYIDAHREKKRDIIRQSTDAACLL